jgi:hypothetical protein
LSNGKREIHLESVVSLHPAWTSDLANKEPKFVIFVGIFHKNKVPLAKYIQRRSTTFLYVRNSAYIWSCLANPPLRAHGAAEFPASHALPFEMQQARRQDRGRRVSAPPLP